MLRVIDLMQCRKASNSNSWPSHSLPFTFFFSLSSSLSHLLNAFDVHKVSEKSMCNFFFHLCSASRGPVMHFCQHFPSLHKLSICHPVIYSWIHLCISDTRHMLCSSSSALKQCKLRFTILLAGPILSV